MSGMQVSSWGTGLIYSKHRFKSDLIPTAVLQSHRGLMAYPLQLGVEAALVECMAHASEDERLSPRVLYALFATTANRQYPHFPFLILISVGKKHRRFYRDTAEMEVLVQVGLRNSATEALPKLDNILQIRLGKFLGLRAHTKACRQSPAAHA